MDMAVVRTGSLSQVFQSRVWPEVRYSNLQNQLTVT